MKTTKRYKYIYIRAPKSASTSIVNALGECGNNKSRNAYHPSCMRHSWEKDLKPGELEKIWNDYFVFGFVRNPWRRAFSLYKYIHTTVCLHWCVFLAVVMSFLGGGGRNFFGFCWRVLLHK